MRSLGEPGFRIEAEEKGGVSSIGEKGEGEGEGIVQNER